MKNGIHLQRSEANSEFYVQAWQGGRELARTTETYKRRAGALGAFMSTARLFNKPLIAFYYWDHTQGDKPTRERFEKKER